MKQMEIRGLAPTLLRGFEVGSITSRARMTVCTHFHANLRQLFNLKGRPATSIREYQLILLSSCTVATIGHAPPVYDPSRYQNLALQFHVLKGRAHALAFSPWCQVTWGFTKITDP